MKKLFVNYIKILRKLKIFLNKIKFKFFIFNKLFKEINNIFIYNNDGL